MNLSFIEPHWDSWFERLNIEIPDPIPSDWRSNPVINSACEYAALDVLANEAKYLVGKFDRYDEMLSVNPPTVIHHLYHIARWQETVGSVVDPVNILEWGGGYGSMARLVLDFFYPNASYTIIDHPAMHRFSKHFLGDRKVTRIDIDQARSLGDDYDLFISTWALSESAEPAQDYVVLDRNFYDANHLLIGYDPGSHFYGTRHFANLASTLSGSHEDTSVLGSKYIFR